MDFTYLKIKLFFFNIQNEKQKSQNVCMPVSGCDIFFLALAHSLSQSLYYFAFQEVEKEKNKKKTNTVTLYLSRYSEIDS